MKSDLLEVMLATSEGTLSKIVKSGGCSWDSRACVCVVCVSKGYPGEYENGKEISGLDSIAQMKDVVVFHAGTIKSPSHQVTKSQVKYLTSGGRVLGVTGLGGTIKEAIDTAYKAVEKIKFEGMQYRKDIGRKALSGHQDTTSQRHQ
jgi:phosphoribosylamine--glycine ligase